MFFINNEIGGFVIFKNLIEIYEKELERKISIEGENYYIGEVSFIKRYYYDYFDRNLNKMILHFKELPDINFKNKFTDCYNSVILFISLYEKYFPEIK